MHHIGKMLGLAALAGCAADGAPAAETSSDASSSAGSSSGGTSSGADTTTTGDTTAASSESSGADTPVLPTAGFWRWQSMDEIVDGCGIYDFPFDYGLTQITDVSEPQFSMQPWGGMVHACPLTGSGFSCEQLPLLGFPPPAETTTEFDGAFVEAEAGSMAFRIAATCEGAECAMIAMDAGIEFPCESTALTQGTRLTDVELVDEGCATEGSLISSMTPEQAVVTFVNDSAEDIQLYWLDFDGARADFGVIAAGASQLVWTYMTHAWLLANGADECLRIHLPTQDAGLVTIE